MPVRDALTPFVFKIHASMPSAEVPDIKPITVTGVFSAFWVISSLFGSHSGFAVYPQSASVGA